MALKAKEESGSEVHQTENCPWLSQAVNDLQLCLNLMQHVFITKSRTGSPGLRKINISLVMPMWLVLALQIFPCCTSGLQGGFGAQRGDFWGVILKGCSVLCWGSCSWGGFLRCVKAAIAQCFSKSGAYVEAVGPNVDLSN